MGIIATAVAHLIAAGVTGDALVAAIEQMEAAAAPDSTAEKRRAWDRERKRRQREANSGGIPPDPVETVENPAPDKSPPDPQKLTPTPGAPTHETRAREAKTRIFVCPEGVDPQHWSDFLANRHRKRLAKTQTAYQSLLRQLAELSDDEWPPGRIVEFAAGRGWGAFFDPRGRDDGRNGHGKRNGADRVGGDRGRGRTIAAALDFVEAGGHH